MSAKYWLAGAAWMLFIVLCFPLSALVAPAGVLLWTAFDSTTANKANGKDNT